MARRVTARLVVTVGGHGREPRVEAIEAGQVRFHDLGRAGSARRDRTLDVCADHVVGSCMVAVMTLKIHKRFWIHLWF